MKIIGVCEWPEELKHKGILERLEKRLRAVNSRVKIIYYPQREYYAVYKGRVLLGRSDVEHMKAGSARKHFTHKILCPKRRVGDTVYLRFTTGVASVVSEEDYVANMFGKPGIIISKDDNNFKGTVQFSDTRTIDGITLDKLQTRRPRTLAEAKMTGTYW
jgi:hypothetical protein